MKRRNIVLIVLGGIAVILGIATWLFFRGPSQETVREAVLGRYSPTGAPFADFIGGAPAQRGHGSTCGPAAWTCDCYAENVRIRSIKFGGNFFDIAKVKATWTEKHTNCRDNLWRGARTSIPPEEKSGSFMFRRDGFFGWSPD